MGNILTGLFKKGTEVQNLQGEQASLSKQAGELQQKVTQVNNALVMAQTELMIEDNATNKKKVEKFQKALEGFTKELEAIQTKSQEVQAKLAELNIERRKAEIEEIALADLANYEKSYRSSRLASELEKMKYKIGTGSNNIGSSSPSGLLKEAGVEIGYFSPSEAHKPYKELWEEKRNNTNEQVEKDLEEVKKAIEKFLNK